ncbi:Hypothetical protein, putative [Bodo saltans]|uniref:C2 domain-containing protein n=1 Tax=Bodo saltans TaxID=75058 RepID=A0A0S4J8U7_BODSA|nr:Hypothetical protein, putative [Bodo saltans]|eukprot:CUG86526.1 Hypothetical protein, putative [Bodo saltans]
MAEGIQPSKLTIDIVRLKKLPQTEDEPLACSSSVQIICLESANTLHFVSDTQKNTNNPYFNQTVERELPPALNDVPALSFLVEIVEHQRQSNPAVILFSSFSIDQDIASHTTGKTEVNLILTTVNPLDKPDAARAEEDKIRNSSDAPTLVIRYKLTAPKAIKPVYDPNADVVLDFMPELTGDHRLVPDIAPLAWFNLIADPLWCEKFSACVVETWKSIPSLSVQIRRMSGGEALLPQPKKPGSAKGGATPRGGSAGGGGAGGIKTFSDVVTQSWVCKRNHQLLSRLRISAEKFATGDPSLSFTIEEEIEWKRYWKERAVLRMQQCRKSFETSGSTDKLRTTLDRLWMLMAAGIPAEGPAPNLGFDVRHKLNQATFSTSSAEVLLTCLTNRLVPWLSYQECEVLSKDDADPRTIPSCVRNASFPTPVADPKQAHVFAFVDVMASFVGRIVDTLTDAEFASALEYFVPAVREAHMRASGSAAGADAAAISLGGGTKKSRSGSAKKGKKEKGSPAASPEKRGSEAAAAASGGVAAGGGGAQPAGLAIKHLDNLGRRTDDAKFA